MMDVRDFCDEMIIMIIHIIEHRFYTIHGGITREIRPKYTPHTNLVVYASLRPSDIILVTISILGLILPP